MKTKTIYHCEYCDFYHEDEDVCREHELQEHECKHIHVKYKVEPKSFTVRIVCTTCKKVVNCIPIKKENIVKDPAIRGYLLHDDEIVILSTKAMNYLADALYEICDSQHASCNSDCPVYYINGSNIPYEKDTDNCKCFKNGVAMLKFIIEKARENK